jgi:hypothetical protein
MPVTVALGGPIRSLVDAVIVQPPVDRAIAPSVVTAEKSAIRTSKQEIRTSMTGASLV